jgi:exodeoxyribonuclease VII small subunit
VVPETGLKCRRAEATVVPSVETKNEQPSFEEALAKLESIVESMESGEVPLAELIARFEQGTKLLQACETRLKEAELRIEQLKKSKDGSIAFGKFETDRET